MVVRMNMHMSHIIYESILCVWVCVYSCELVILLTPNTRIQNKRENYVSIILHSESHFFFFLISGAACDNTD